MGIADPHSQAPTPKETTMDKSPMLDAMVRRDRQVLETRRWKWMSAAILAGALVLLIGRPSGLKALETQQDRVEPFGRFCKIGNHYLNPGLIARIESIDKDSQGRIP